MKSINAKLITYLLPFILLSCAFGDNDQEAFPGGENDGEFLDNELGDDLGENINSQNVDGEFSENNQFGQNGQFNQGNQLGQNNQFNNFQEQGNNQINFDEDNNFDENQGFNQEQQQGGDNFEQQVVSQTNFSNDQAINIEQETFIENQQVDVNQGATDLGVEATSATETIETSSSAGRVKYVVSRSNLYNQPDGQAVSSLEQGDHPLVFDEGVWNRTSDGYYVPTRDLTERPIGRSKKRSPWF